jgi:DNA-binding transcriptional ArsR family regulator
MIAIIVSIKANDPPTGSRNFPSIKLLIILPVFTFSIYIINFRVCIAGLRNIRILYALFEEEVCVCDLAQLLGMTQSAVSHQLRVLKQARLIRSRREGKTVFYALADEHVRTLLSNGTDHINE